MYIIGLTGGIASGKSTVSRTLAKLGARIIDTDEISHQIIEPGQPAWHDIVEYFGNEVVNPDNSINRVKLGAIVFNDPDSLKKLNSFTHPRVMDRLRADLKAIEDEQANAIVFMEVPLLYETHMEKLCREVWVVWVDSETQIIRLMARDAIDREYALRRIASQMPLEEKAARADRIIDNSGSVEETIEITTRIFNEILQNNVV
ncbi:MAG: dephospho-CoA kinase [Syntrophomonadaceae bacterium]|nr:dephospho-CoA kinase [Syntrophomonadaceae bacterium]